MITIIQRIEAFDYDEVRNFAIRWIETQMIHSGRRLWGWHAEYLGENDYELVFMHTPREMIRG